VLQLAQAVQKLLVPLLRLLVAPVDRQDVVVHEAHDVYDELAAHQVIETHGVGFVSLERDPLRGLCSFSVYEEIPILQIPAGQKPTIGDIR
jgi:hypothetical protein